MRCHSSGRASTISRLCYVGHAEKWDKVDSDGSIEDHDCKLSFQRAGRTLAVATIGRDLESLYNELAMEQPNGKQNPTRSPKRRASTNPERARGGRKGAQGEPSKVGTI